MLTPAQQERLQSLHAYEWADDDPETTTQNLDTIFKEIETEEELWYASFIVPWDFADGSLHRILNHKLCERGIALFLYWALDPISCHRNEGASPLPIAALITEIEGRFDQGHFDTEHIAFSPLDSPNYHADHTGIPTPLLAPTTGLAVEFDYRKAVFTRQQEDG